MVVLMDYYWVELWVDKTAAWMVLNWAAMMVGMKGLKWGLKKVG